MPYPSIEPGEFRHALTLQQMLPGNPVTYDASGPVLVPTTFAANVYAKIEYSHGRDELRGGMEDSQVRLRIWIRFIYGVVPQMRVQIPDYSTDPPGLDYYIIQDVLNVEKRNLVLRLDCLGIGANL